MDTSRKERWYHPEVFQDLVTEDTRLMDLFQRAVELNGNTVFMKEYETSECITWKEMAEKVERISKGMMAFGIDKGDHVLLWGSNSIEWVACFLACLRIGAVSILGNTANKEVETAYLLKDSNIKMILMDQGTRHADYKEIVQALVPGAIKKEEICSVEFPDLKYIIIYDSTEKEAGYTRFDLYEKGGSVDINELEKREQSILPTDIINIQYTSGTTGDPKGVMWDQHCLMYNLEGVYRDVHMRVGEKMYSPLPFFHNFGLLGCIVYPIIVGCVVVFSKKFQAQNYLRAIETERPDVVLGVTTMFLVMLADPEFDSYQVGNYPMKMILAGSLCPQHLLEGLRDKFRTENVVVIYGLTEAAASANTKMSDPMEQQLTSIGRASGQYKIRICDPVTRKTLPFGEEGEIAIKGIAVMRGYYNKPEETKEVMDSDGWFYTGDIACMDANGFIYIKGRLKDMINRGGEKIFPKELENFLIQHPAVADAQIVGIPSKKYGEEAAAFIVCNHDMEITAEEVKQFIGEKMAVYKIPRYVFFVDKFPCTLSGKVQKYKLIEKAMKELGL